MINLTYEDALTAIDKLINELESIKENKEFEIKNITERYLIIDALALLEKKLDEELREKLEKNNFRIDIHATKAHKNEYLKINS